MAEYVLIESRDPFESNDVGYYYDLARGLVESGNQVTLFLLRMACSRRALRHTRPRSARWRKVG